MKAFLQDIALTRAMTNQGRVSIHKSWLALLVLSVLIPLLYWRVIAEPFVQDDWFLLYLFRWSSLGEIIQRTFDPVGKILYRPVGIMYLLGMYLLADLSTTPFHILAIIIHIANAFLVFQIVRQITKNDLLSFASGALYGLAVSVHIELLFWIVGFYDVGQMFFFLSSFLLFMNRRLVPSVAAFLVAIFIKESTVGLLGVFVGYLFFIEKRPLRQLIPYLVISIIYLFLKALGDSPFSVAASHPYKAQLTGGHILHNLSLYLDWGLEALFPFHRWLPPFVEGSIIIVLGLLVLKKFWDIRSAGLPMPKTALFLATWLVSGIILIVFLPNHGAKYYLVTSLPPFLALSMLFVDFILPASMRKAALPLAVIFLVLVAASNWIMLEQQFADRADRVRVSNGTDNLFQKAEVVKRVHAQLAAQFPSLQDSTTVIINDADIGPMGDSAAVRLWYDNRTIDVMNQQRYDSLTAVNQGYLSRPVVVLQLPPRSE